ncbi:hypothetical protein SAY87_002275 [Trapa incisa]|uniref:Transcription factor WD40-like family n=1 Tax=Trapa incisa TaxID=236973 RepID=A0AAN7PUL5_9MYRT|nr:hypothetical protein SAY87_002275 [Trapa incisa]
MYLALCKWDIIMYLYLVIWNAFLNHAHFMSSFFRFAILTSFYFPPLSFNYLFIVLKLPDLLIYFFRVCCNTKNSGSGAEPSSSRLGSSDAETSSHGSPEVLLIEFCDGNDKPSPDLSHSRTKSQRKEIGSCGLPVITADEYVYRSALLSALVIAWSPLLQSSSESCSGYERPPSYSVLAVGGKSGTISFWRIDMPKVYSIEHANVHPSVAFIWSLQAHNSWVTTISWLLLTSDSSSTSICLASGSSDGSVRIWLGSTEDFSRPTEGTCCPFILLKEIIIADPATAPVSVVSLTLSSESQEKMFIAIGKGSGSFEVWMDYKLSGEFQKISSVNAHGHVITGLTWAYNGNSLFSSSQDNFVRRWSVNENCISEIPISSNTPGPRALGDLPSAFYSCHGVAVSPGNLVLAMVRSFDSDLLNPMYQSRSLKAAVEFFWIGGQEHCISSDASLKSKTECVPHFPHGLTKSRAIISSLTDAYFVGQEEEQEKEQEEEEEERASYITKCHICI